MPNTLATGIFWYWNATPTPAGICKQLKHIAEAGFDCVYIHPMPDEFHKWNFFIGMKCSYLGEKYFDLVEIALDECKKLGLTMMLYDEGGWPSGGVLDRLIKRYPECRGSFLIKDEAGNIQKTDAAFPDLLNKNTTMRFIEMTHELYRRRFGKEFGKTIKGIFTDEPFFQMVSDENRVYYTPAMDKLAKEMFDCSFTDDLLPFLWNGTETLPEAASARRKYMAITSRLFAENYFAVLEKWCEKHHLLSVGHVNNEDIFFSAGNCGDLPEQFAHLHIPGVDAIWRQIYPGSSTGCYANFASSSAIARNRSHALCECFNVYSYALTPPAMNWVANAMFLRGINHLLPMPYLYTDFGKHKICCSTDISPRMPWWNAMKEMVRRWKIAANFDLSKMEVPIWVLARNKYSIPDSLWDNNPARIQAREEMESMLKKFDCNAIPWRFTSTGELQHCEKLPEILIITQELDDWEKSIIDRFIRQGVKIFAGWDEKLQKFAPVQVKNPDSGCLVRSCIREDKEAIMLFNPGNAPKEFTFASEGIWGEIALDEAAAELYPLTSSGDTYALMLPPGALRILEKGKTSGNAEMWKKSPLKLEWKLEKVKKLRMAAEKTTTMLDVPVQEQFLYDGMYLEKDFSGIIKLSAVVEMPEVCSGFITFERICHAGKLTVNGINCTTQIAAPWAFPVKFKRGKNLLTLEIYSSAGNEWRRCINEELEPVKWVNGYLKTMRKYVIDDAETGVSGTAMLWVAE